MLKKQFVVYNDEELALEVKKIDKAIYDIETINQEMSHEFGITIAKIYFTNALFEQEECINDALNKITSAIAEAVFNKEPDTAKTENKDISIQFLTKDDTEHEKCKITFDYQINNSYYELFEIIFSSAYHFQAKSTDNIIKKTISKVVEAMQEVVGYYKNDKKLTMVATKVDYNNDYNLLIKRFKFNNLHYFKISKIHKTEQAKTHIYTIMINDIYQDNIISAIMNTNINLTQKILGALEKTST